MRVWVGRWEKLLPQCIPLAFVFIFAGIQIRRRGFHSAHSKIDSMPLRSCARASIQLFLIRSVRFHFFTPQNINKQNKR